MICTGVRTGIGSGANSPPNLATPVPQQIAADMAPACDIGEGAPGCSTLTLSRRHCCCPGAREWWKADPPLADHQAGNVQHAGLSCCANVSTRRLEARHAIVAALKTRKDRVTLSPDT